MVVAMVTVTGSVTEMEKSADGGSVVRQEDRRRIG